MRSPPQDVDDSRERRPEAILLDVRETAGR
jgi:hypothetical protein